MTLSPVVLITYQIYLLQLENYRMRRFFRGARASVLAAGLARRTKTVWTPKLKATTAIALFLWLCVIAGIATVVTIQADMVTAMVWSFVGAWLMTGIFFLFLALATLVLLPLDKFLKGEVISAAHQKLALHKKLTVIGITGSYGKTTAKEVLAAILAEKFSMLKTPDNINTPVGVARLINARLTDATEIFIVEMGAYERGDIKALCDIARPDIVMLTGINESHLERFGSIENTIATKFEIVEHAKPNSHIVLNADDERIVASYQQYATDRRVRFFSAEENSRAALGIKDIRFAADGALSGTFTRTGVPAYTFTVPLLGAYAVGTLMGCVIIAEHLGMSHDEIERGITMVRPIPHRLQPIRLQNNVLVIDDSYNGNPKGVRAATEVLERFSGRRKVFITPGLVEMGKESSDIHNALGRELSKAVDVLVLIRTKATDALAKGFLETGVPKNRIMWFDTTLQAHAALPSIIKPNDVVLFQNDIPDNYK